MLPLAFYYLVITLRTSLTQLGIDNTQKFILQGTTSGILAIYKTLLLNFFITEFISYKVNTDPLAAICIINIFFLSSLFIYNCLIQLNFPVFSCVAYVSSCPENFFPHTRS